MQRNILLVSYIILLSACSDLAVKEGDIDIHDPTQEYCHDIFQTVNQFVRNAGVVDAEAKRVPDFPYLRSNRFLASLAYQSNEYEYNEAWIDSLIALELQGRKVEFTNLTASQSEMLEKKLVKEGESRSVENILYECTEKLKRYDLAQFDRINKLKHLVQIPDEYSILKRSLGLYPVTRYLFYLGYKKWKNEHLDTFNIDHKEKQWLGKAVIYEPITDQRPGLLAKDVARIIEHSRKPPLYIPEPDPENLQILVEQFAPVFLIDEKTTADRIGRPEWSPNENLIVNYSVPVVFVRTNYTWFENEILLQLVYTLWFPERPEVSRWDLLSGKLDGIIWRITIDSNGTPLIADSIHPCGCYHLFFPNKHLENKQSDAKHLHEDNIIPINLPNIDSDERILIRIASRTHYIEALSVASTENKSWQRQFYQLSFQQPVPELDLRAMPTKKSKSKSLYHNNGIVVGTGRRERWLLWPTGVWSPGAMRQWGKHATAFIGRRHFDDPYLFDEHFMRREHE